MNHRGHWGPYFGPLIFGNSKQVLLSRCAEVEAQRDRSQADVGHLPGRKPLAGFALSVSPCGPGDAVWDSLDSQIKSCKMKRHRSYYAQDCFHDERFKLFSTMPLASTAKA